MPDTPSPSTWNAAVFSGVARGTGERRVLFPPPRSSAGTHASIACPSFLAAPALALCKIWGAGWTTLELEPGVLNLPASWAPGELENTSQGQGEPNRWGGGELDPHRPPPSSGEGNSRMARMRGWALKSRDGQRSPKNNTASLPWRLVPLRPTEQTWPQGAGCAAPAWCFSLVLSPSNFT